MHVLLIASSDSSSTLKDVNGLASSAVRRGHEVTVFLHMRGALLIKASEARDNIRWLVSQGVQMLACRTSVNELQMEPEEITTGAELSSLGELVELMNRGDRVLFLG